MTAKELTEKIADLDGMEHKQWVSAVESLLTAALEEAKKDATFDLALAAGEYQNKLVKTAKAAAYDKGFVDGQNDRDKVDALAYAFKTDPEITYRQHRDIMMSQVKASVKAAYADCANMADRCLINHELADACVKKMADLIRAKAAEVR